jgi:E3 ubiquitin-protein ligase RNF11
MSSTLPVYYPSPNVSRSASQLTEEEQIKIAQRMGLIQHLPTGLYDGSKKNREFVEINFI